MTAKNAIWSKDMSLALDSAAGTLTDISTYVNSQSFDAAITILDVTGMGDDDPDSVNGLSHRTVPISGLINSTTSGIFKPLQGGTTVRKAWEFGINDSNYVNGSCLPESVSFSGSPDTLETFSCSLRIVGSVNETTVTLVGG